MNRKPRSFCSFVISGDLCLPLRLGRWSDMLSSLRGSGPKSREREPLPKSKTTSTSFDLGLSSLTIGERCCLERLRAINDLVWLKVDSMFQQINKLIEKLFF